MGKGIEEIDKTESKLPWDDGLELRRDVFGPMTVFRLLLGGASVGTLRIGTNGPDIEADAAWAARLLEEVREEWRRTESLPLEMAA